MQRRWESTRRYIGFIVSAFNNLVTFCSFVVTILVAILAPIWAVWMVLGIVLFLAFLTAFYRAFKLNEKRPVETVQDLRRELESAAKAKRLLESRPNARFRVVQVFKGARRGFSIILYSDQACQFDYGTPFEVRRTDQLNADGLIVPKTIGVVRAMSTAIGKKPFEARLERGHKDADFWRSVQRATVSGNPYNPPRNEAIPYVPAQLHGLSAADMEAFEKTLAHYQAGV